MRRLAAALAGLVAACSSGPGEEPPPPIAAPTTPVARAPLPNRDACGAAELQHLVGRPRSEIPVPVRPDLQRVACTTCPVTMDFNQNRLNFFFDAGTGVIREIRCG
ncbi:MAG TPA: peptidase inhibitor I78 [Alphaproteobacteria bacterium]|nr:peptidase inhibitor I78 [Alphaproteobacteria bacterium]